MQGTGRVRNGRGSGSRTASAGTRSARSNQAAVVTAALDVSNRTVVADLDALESRLVDALAAAFGSSGSDPCRIGAGRVAVVIERPADVHAALSRLPSMLELAIDDREVWLWVEEIPVAATRQVLADLHAAAEVATLPASEADEATDPAEPATRQRARRSLGSLGSARWGRSGPAVAGVAALSVAVMGIGSLILPGGIGEAPDRAIGRAFGVSGRSVTTEGVALAGDASAPDRSGEAVESGGSQTVESSTSTEATGGAARVGDPSGRHGEIASTVVAVGLPAAEAVALLPDGYVARRVIEGVPGVDALSADASVVIVLRGAAPPELCLLLDVGSVVTLVGDPFDCAESDAGEPPVPGADAEIDPPAVEGSEADPSPVDPESEPPGEPQGGPPVDS